MSGASVVVKRSTLKSVLDALRMEKFLSCDDECTGLYPHKGDVLFSFIIGTATQEFYFNFECYPEITDDENLDTPECWQAIREFFACDNGRTFFGHNFRFDLSFLRKEGIEVAGTLHDTKTCARLLWNDHMRYSLKDCVKRDIGAEKDDTVEKYVEEHGLFEIVENPHKNIRERKVFYNRVPFDIICKYGCQDARITYDLGVKQLELIAQEGLERVYSLECSLIRPILDMEYRGIGISEDYCHSAIAAEESRQSQAKQEFEKITGKAYCDSNKLFGEIFAGVEVSKTAKGAPSFDRDSLESMGDNPVAKAILKYRDAKKQADYFHGFLHHAVNGVIHPNFLADGTGSGRFSSQNPNLQNLSRPNDEHEGPEPRAAFIPREGFSFYIFDYAAQEHRLLVDLAGATGMAQTIRDGVDIHQQTADAAGVTRYEAKVILFSTLYGAGINKIAETLKCTPAKAKSIRDSIMNASPEIKKFIRSTIQRAENFKKVSTWYGRVSRFPSREDCYRAPNYVIQGGCADITKLAIVKCGEFLQDKKSRMVLTVHDSIVFEIAHGEEHLLPALKRIMVEAYAHKFLPMDVSIDFAPNNMAETTKIKL